MQTSPAVWLLQMTRFVTRRDVASRLHVTYNQSTAANAGKGMLQRAAALGANVLAASYTRLNYRHFLRPAGEWLCQ